MLKCTTPNKPLSELEQLVIDFLNQNAKNLHHMSITDVANYTFSSVATVSRAVRKCGFSSFTDARFSLVHSTESVDERFCFDDSLSRSYIECTRTIENINIQDIANVAKLIRHSKRIILLARGITRIVAEEFLFYLQCLHLNAALLTDGKIMEKFDLYANPDDVVIILTAQCTTPELITAAQQAKSKGCRVITFCCKKSTPLETLSDIQILGFSFHISPIYNLGSISRIPLMIITRSVVEYIGLIENTPDNLAQHDTR